MNVKLQMPKRFDWERLGSETMLECERVDEAIEICGLHLQACSDELQPKLTRLHPISTTTSITPMLCMTFFMNARCR
jgi:hypothetical protein